MRVGLVFLTGLLVGGLVVAWLAGEAPTQSGQAVPVAQAPAVPEAPAPDEAVVQAPVPAALPVSLPGEEIATAAAPTNLPEALPEPGPVARAVSDEPLPPVQDTPLLPPLRIPVQGIDASQLVDTFADARGEDRVHDALDIMAAEGTPVLAVADGPVVKLFDSVPGGLTLYQFDQAGQVAFYYAHLQGYAQGVEEGKQLRQGEVLGYVGHTGNANAAAPHLHFAITVLGPEKRWWEGEAINPYPLLAGPAD